ncbi:MAG: T9SS type A sorting domain-containing protein [Bacteroidota bacterium]
MKNIVSLKLIISLFLVFLFNVANSFLFAQSSYTLNGDASHIGGDCFNVTPNLNSQKGTIWYSNKINMNTPFDIDFNIQFSDPGGDPAADGMVFVLQTVGNTAMGLDGEGMGFDGFSPSLGVEFDVFDNSSLGDLSSDHIAVQKNGNPDHTGGGNLAGPVQATTLTTNIADGNTHRVRISWNPATNNFKVYFDCELRIDLNYNIRTIFAPSTEAWFGFTGATGLYHVQQVVCLDNNMLVALYGNTTICQNESVELNLSGTDLTNVLWTPNTSISDITSITPTVFPPVTTTYYVSYKDGCNFNRMDSIQINVNPAPIAAISASPNLCLGNSVVLSGSGGGSYVWSSSPAGFNSNNQNPSVSPVANTTYTLKVTDGNGCSDTENFVLNVSSFPTATATAVSSNICNGQTTTLNGGGGVSYSWTSNPVGFTSNLQNPTISPTQNTTYTVVVTNGFGCTDDATVAVTVTAMSSATASATSASICNGQTTSLNGGGGAGYSWTSNPVGFTSNLQNPSISPTQNTTYTVVVTNGFGCTDDATAIVTVNPMTSATASATSGSICNGLTTSINGGGGVSYSWTSNPVGFTSNLQNPIISPAQNTTYTVVVTNGFGCTDDATAIVNVFNTPTVDAGGNQTILNGTNTTLDPSVSGGLPTYNYQWNPSLYLSNSNIENPQTTNLSSNTTYNLTVTDANGCTASDFVVISITGSPLNVITNTSNSILCTGGQTQLNANTSGGSGLYSYLWSASPSYDWTANGSNQNIQNPIVLPTISTVFTVTVSDGFNTVTGQVSVTVNPLPIAEAGAEQSICIGASVTLIASGGTPVWNNGITNGLAFFPTATNTYTVTVTDANSCTNTDNIIVNVIPKPIVEAGNEIIICSGNSVTLHAIGDNNPVWNGGAVQDVPFVPTSSGSYVVTVTGASSCTNTDMVQVTVNPKPNIQISGVTQLCNGDTLVLNATGGGTYQWTNNGMISNSQISNPTIYPTTSTNYSLTVTSDLGCTNTSNISIQVFPVIIPNITSSSPSAFCYNNPAPVHLYAPSGFANYLWSNAETTQTITVNQTGNYTVTVTDANGCKSISALHSVVNSSEINPYIIVNGPSVICFGERVDLITDTVYHTYEWSTGSTTNIISAFESGNYNVTVSDFYGCKEATDSVTIVVDPKPEVYFSYEKFQSNVHFYNYTFFGTDFTWDFGDGSASFVGNNPIHDYTAKGSYWVKLTAVNDCGTDIDSILIVIDQMTNVDDLIDGINQVSIYPNPVSDEVNLLITSLESNEMQISILNLMGQIVNDETINLTQGSMEYAIDCSKLSKGFYSIVLKTDKGIMTRKIIKE